MKNNFHRNAERGFSLIELAIYVVMATLIFLAIAVSIQYAYRFYRELTIGPRADRVAASLIERVAVSEGRITYTENDGPPRELTPADITVSRLLLTYLTSPVSEGVRIELELTYEMQGLARTKTYTGFAILRHSYE